MEAMKGIVARRMAGNYSLDLNACSPDLMDPGDRWRRHHGGFAWHATKGTPGFEPGTC